MKRNLRFLISLLIFLLAVAAVPVFASADMAEVNVMVYMIGSDLESKDGYATDNVNELLEGMRKADDRVNCLVYGGGAKHWHNSIFTSLENRCVKIDCEGAELLYAEKNTDMTESDTLLRFLRFCTVEYPAKKNILILWDHGGGVFQGFGRDELFPDSDPMDILQIKNALLSLGTHFDIIGFDACLMANLENVYSMVGLTDYLIASEAVEPGFGWDYNIWVSQIAEEPDLKMTELCKRIVNTYIWQCMVELPDFNAQLSAFNIEKFAEKVPPALSSFCRNRLLKLKESGTVDVEMVRIFTEQISRMNRVDEIDLIDFMRNVGGVEAIKLEDALRSSFVCSRTNHSVQGLNGVSIYVPYRDGKFTEFAVNDYIGLMEYDLHEEYIDWLRCYTAYLDIYRAVENQQRTLLDVLNQGTNQNTDMTAEQLKELKMDPERFSFSTDENDLPVLIAAENDKKNLHCFLYSLEKNLNGTYVRYGTLQMSPEDFPLGNNKMWSTLCGGRLTVNGSDISFTMEGKVQLNDFQTRIYGYSPFRAGEKYGFLFFKLTYNADTDSIEVEPTGFQPTYMKDGKAYFDRMVPLSRIAQGERVSFWTIETISPGESEYSVIPLGIDFLWGEPMDFEWTPGMESGLYSRGYFLEDIFGNLYMYE